MAKALLISCLIAVVTAQINDKYIQRVTLYKELGCQGASITFQKKNARDLKKFGWADTAHSAKVTGVWLFYSLPNYNPDGNGSMEYIFGIDLCGNFGSLAGYVNSIRFAGFWDDYRTEALSIYKAEYFKGQAEFTSIGIQNVNMEEHNSIIGLGTSGWTLYDEPDFKGTSVCVWYAEDFGAFHMFYFRDLEKEMPEMFNKIRSIKLGCT